MHGSSIAMGAGNPLADTSAVDVLDDILFTIGTDSDSVALNRSDTLLANTALTGVLEGTPVSPALAANTLIIANTTNDGDILIAASDGGTSKACLFFDASTPDLILYLVGGTWTAGATAWVIPAVTLGGAATVNDDIFLVFGGVHSLGHETADANANALILALADGGATDVPVFVIGDQSILNADLGWFNGVVEPTIAVVNALKDAYVSLDAGDDAIASAKGLYFKPAADEDVEVINLSVTGTPRIFWDESTDAFSTNMSWILTGTDKPLLIGQLVRYTTNYTMLEISTPVDSWVGASFNSWANSAGAGALLELKKSRAAVVGTHTVCVTGDILAGIDVYGSDGTAFRRSGYEVWKATGTMGDSRIPGLWELHCYTDAATSVDTTVMTATATTVSLGSAIVLAGVGTGANGIKLKNPKNAAASALSGTQLDVEIDIGGTPYYFTVYPTKA